MAKGVIVKWLDSAGFNESIWYMHDQMEGLYPEEVISVGFLYKETSTYITLVLNQTEVAVHGTMSIPKFAIIYRKDFDIETEDRERRDTGLLSEDVRLDPEGTPRGNRTSEEVDEAGLSGVKAGRECRCGQYQKGLDDSYKGLDGGGDGLKPRILRESPSSTGEAFGRPRVYGGIL